jgi:hypothetical protein
METTVGKAEGGEVVVEHHMPVRSRLIVGPILGLPAAFFLYYLVIGLVAYVRSATPSEWLSAMPGLLVVLGLFLVCAVPAWIALAGRRWTILDFERGQVFSVRDLRFYRRIKTTPLNRVRDVYVAEKFTRTHDRKSEKVFEVQLLVANGKPIRVGNEASGADAADLARRLRARLKATQAEPAAR